MVFEWFVAARYLKGSHRGRVRICTAGVTIGVMVLIVVISVMNGFERDFLGKMLGAYGHLRLFPYPGDTALTDYKTWIERFESFDRVKAAAPAIEQDAMITTQLDRYRDPVSQGVSVRGIDPTYELEVNNFRDLLLLGEWNELLPSEEDPGNASATVAVDPFADLETEIPPVFLGVELAKFLFKAPPHWHWSATDNRLKNFFESEVIGKKIKIVVAEPSRDPAGMQAFNFIEGRVGGIFQTGFFDFDLRYVLTSLDTSRMLKRMPVYPPSALFLEFKLDDPQHADAVGLEIASWANEQFSFSFAPVSWQQLNPVLLEAVKIEKVVMGAILTMVILVAAFGISSTLVMTVLEKTREIGTLMSMGTRRTSIMSIFVINGFLVGLLGVLLGTALGLGICGAIDILDLRMPGGGEVYVLDKVPVQIRWMDVLIIDVFSLLASTVAGIYPAWKAAKLDPVEALGHE
jgi:lipoprotein-releasing system permease protein